jgi:hypothetical protein
MFIVLKMKNKDKIIRQNKIMKKLLQIAKSRKNFDFYLQWI